MFPRRRKKEMDVRGMREREMEEKEGEKDRRKGHERGKKQGKME